jgi:hypothetical protein
VDSDSEEEHVDLTGNYVIDSDSESGYSFDLTADD